MKPYGIIVFGPNGSGKTTLARELAKMLNFKHIDVEDYYFEESEIPYSVVRTKEECTRLMLADIEKYGNFVLSGCIGDYGDEIPTYYELAVHIEAPLELRLERVKNRAYEQYGNRILEGGDMYESEQKFFDFVTSRPLWKIEDWAKTLTCPIIYVDGTADWKYNAKKIAETVKESRSDK